eukprot:216147_1
MSTSMRHRATKNSKSTNTNKSKRKSRQKSHKITKKKQNKNKSESLTFRIPLIFRILIAIGSILIGSILLLTFIYIFNHYYTTTNTTNSTINHDTSQVSQNDHDIDITQIINHNDLDLNKTKLKEMSPRFSKIKKKKVPTLQLWSIQDFWTKDMALNISNQIYNEFMNESTRQSNFYFTVNHGNEKIRGNDNIEMKTLTAKQLFENSRFSYCKYEYRRDLPLYKSVLSYLNSSFVSDILSKMLKKKILGVTDLFISVFYKDNFLSTHDDIGLGHYAFVNFLSQDWNFDRYGGALHFNCQTRRDWRKSCYGVKFKFNQASFFKVYPESLPHFVSEVSVFKPRIAITGFVFGEDKRGIHWASIAEETGYGVK